MQLFEKPADYQAFEQVMRETLDESSMLICAYTMMTNHWNLLLWPECDGELASSCNGWRSPMFGDGNSTGDMRDWVMFTRGGTSRFRWRATSISGSLPTTLSEWAASESRLASGGGMAMVEFMATLSWHG
jgi:hypothetical protein